MELGRIPALGAEVAGSASSSSTTTSVALAAAAPAAAGLGKRTCSGLFGGGGDLTPTFINDEDTKIFHHYLKNACDKFDKNYYKLKESYYKIWFLIIKDNAREVLISLEKFIDKFENQGQNELP
jgi:hypothetical protein